ncbi:MAG: tyrosine-type recombinase/integrase [Rummeliibacillus sp.]
MYIANCFEEVFANAKNVHSPYLFPSKKGEPLFTQAYRQLNKAAEFAGVEHVGNHTLRKTFSYWFYKATKDIAMLQRHTEDETNNVLKTFRVFH